MSKTQHKIFPNKSFFPMVFSDFKRKNEKVDLERGFFPPSRLDVHGSQTPASQMLEFSRQTTFRGRGWEVGDNRRRSGRGAMLPARPNSGHHTTLSTRSGLVLTSLPPSPRPLSRFHLASRMCLLLVYRSVWIFRYLYLSIVTYRFARARGNR